MINITDIKCTRSQARFILDNGNIITSGSELLGNGKTIIYIDTLKYENGDNLEENEKKIFIDAFKDIDKLIFE